MKFVYFILLLLWSVGLYSQTTITCVDESNSSTVTCLSCSDFDVESSRGLLVSNGAQDAFYHSPVKLSFGSSRVTFTSVHDEGDKSGRFLLSSFNTAYDTEAEIRALLESCGAVGAQTLSISGRDISISDGNTISLPTDNIGTDDQNLSSTVSGTNRTINIENGTGTTINVADNDNSSTNELQNISIVGNQLSIDGATGNTVTIPQDGVGTDDQSITLFSFDVPTKSITIAIEDGGGGSSVSLANLADQLQISGNSLSLVGRAGSIDLSQYLDNTDGQIISGTFNNSNNNLSLSISNGNTHVIPINFVETDPTVAQHIKDITTGDITNWNTDLVDDADNDPTNEKDSLIFGQTAGYNFTIEGANSDTGVIEIIVEIPSDITSIVYGAGGTDDQVLSYNTNTKILSLEDGGTVDLSGLKNSTIERITITGTTASSIQAPFDLFTGENREIFYNGSMCTETGTRTHTNHITINNATETITFYEALEIDDIIVIKSFAGN